MHFSTLERVHLHACDGDKTFVATFEQVIYELTEGERQLIDDLSLVKKVLPTHALPFVSEANLLHFLGSSIMLNKHLHCILFLPVRPGVL